MTGPLARSMAGAFWNSCEMNKNIVRLFNLIDRQIEILR
jgi:hypothetical protein